MGDSDGEKKIDGAFLRLKFDGGRFDPGGFPLDALGQVASADALIREAARDEFFANHQGREHVRAKFEEELELVVTALTPNCATLDIVRRWSSHEDHEDAVGDEFVAGTDRLFGVVRAIEERTEEDDAQDRPVPGMSRKAWRAAARLVEGLQDDETLEITRPETVGRKARSARVTHRVARTIVRESEREEALTEQAFAIVGTPYRINEKEFDIGLDLKEGRDTATVNFAPGQLRKVYAARTEILDTTKMLRLSGLALVDDRGRLHRVTEVKAIDVIGGPPMKSRFENMRRDLKSGWLDPTTPAPSAAFLKRAEDALWRIVTETGIARPHVYPTPRGGVQAEWDLPDTTLNLEIIPRGGLLAFEGVSTNGDEDLDETSEVEAAVTWVGAAFGVSRG